MPTENNIAKLKQKLQELKQELEFLRSEKKVLDEVLDQIPGVFYVYNENFQLIRWNKRHEEVTGYKGNENLGRSPLDFTVESDHDKIRKAAEEVFKTGEIITEGIVLSKTGKKTPYLYTAVNTTVGGENVLLGFGIDITRLKEAQQQLLNSQELYKLLAETLPDGLLISSKENMVYANSAVQDILKIKKNQLFQMNPRDIFHKRHKKVYDMIIERTGKGKSSENKAVLSIRGDGKEIWLNLSCRPIEWEGEKAFVIMVKDITEQRKERIIAQKKTRQLKKENKLLKSKYTQSYGLANIVGKSKNMQEVYDEIITAASIDTNVIVYGESGTGKELVARSIHDLSNRKKGPFITVNCGAIPETLFESEFFGHKKGAFSGATIDKIGFFESAEKGTLFLDEIGEIPLAMQVKLLRAIEGNGFSPVGSTELKKADVRIIAATNRDLKQLVKENKVREDFFYRVHVIPISIPPLRERKEDIPLLIYHFIHKLGDNEDRKFIPDADMKQFQTYDWPGNVRELQNTISRYIVFDSVELDGIQKEKSPENNTLRKDTYTYSGKQNLNSMLENYERQIIRQALELTGSNKSHAAKKLGIDRRSLQRKLKRLNLL